MREFELIDWICRQGDLDPSIVEVGPGDDCAVLRLGAERVLVTTDQALDGVHFVLGEHGAEAAGRKAAARALSDIAAMAGAPLAMAATVAAPKGLSQPDGQALYRGLRSAGDAFACPLVGGDLAAWAEPAGRLSISVTVLGTCGETGPILRSGARPGDAVCVTGALGGAWSGRRHLTFTPRIAEARELARRYEVHSLIDVSDGLAADLGHIVDASGAAAEIDAAAVPVHEDARRREDPLAAALLDGEDYELLFTLAPEQAEALVARNDIGVPVARIGRIVAGRGLALIRAGRRRPLDPGGWEHRT